MYLFYVFNSETAKFMYLFQQNKLLNLCNEYFTLTKTVAYISTPQEALITATFIYML